MQNLSLSRFEFEVLFLEILFICDSENDTKNKEKFFIAFLK